MNPKLHALTMICLLFLLNFIGCGRQTLDPTSIATNELERSLKLFVGATVSDNRRVVVFTVTNKEKFDVRCKIIKAEASYMDSGLQLGLRPVFLEDQTILSNETEFKMEAGEDIIQSYALAHPHAYIDKVTKVEYECQKVKITAVAAGEDHTCVLFDDGMVRCWGGNDRGQLGYGHTRNIGDNEMLYEGAKNIEIGEEAVSIAAGYKHTCAVLKSGKVRCWGLPVEEAEDDVYHRPVHPIGDDELPYEKGLLDLGEKVKRVTLGFGHACALLESGHIKCWGMNNLGQLGYGHQKTIATDSSLKSLPTVNLKGTVQDIVAGQFHACALMGDGKVKCWGYNETCHLGYGHYQDIGDDETPDAAGDVIIGRKVKALSAGVYHTCALLTSGNIKCWGSNEDGRMGIGHEGFIGCDAETLPYTGDYIDVGGKATAITSGPQHTCALLEQGDVVCWGVDFDGQLGYGNWKIIGDNEKPVAAGTVKIGEKVQKIVAGIHHTCALLTSGSLRCWGLNNNGQLGYGNTANVGDDNLPESAGDVQIFEE